MRRRRPSSLRPRAWRCCGARRARAAARGAGRAAGDRRHRAAPRSARDARADSRGRPVPLRARRRALRQPRAPAPAEGAGLLSRVHGAHARRAQPRRPPRSSAAAPPRTPDACYYTDDHYRSFAGSANEGARSLRDRRRRRARMEGCDRAAQGRGRAGEARLRGRRPLEGARQGDAVRRARPRARSCPSTSATTGTRSPTCSRIATGSASTGRAIVLAHTAPWRKDHPTEWATLEEILAEAAEFWKERHVAVLGVHRLTPSLRIQATRFGAGARSYAGPSRAAARASRLSGALAIGDRKLRARRSARGHRGARARARKPASTRAGSAASSTGIDPTTSRFTRNGGIAIRPGRRTTPSTCSRSRVPGTGRGAAESARAPCARVAAVARRGGTLLFVDQPRCDRGAARARRLEGPSR